LTSESSGAVLLQHTQPASGKWTFRALSGQGTRL